MTFIEIWNQLLRKDARLGSPDAAVTFTAGNLKRLLRQVYEQGERETSRVAGKSDLGPVFESIPKGKKR